jgi:hypothetical protein
VRLGLSFLKKKLKKYYFTFFKTKNLEMILFLIDADQPESTQPMTLALNHFL